jgi:hypothetical protein
LPPAESGGGAPQPSSVKSASGMSQRGPKKPVDFPHFFCIKSHAALHLQWALSCVALVASCARPRRGGLEPVSQVEVSPVLILGYPPPTCSLHLLPRLLISLPVASS